MGGGFHGPPGFGVTSLIGLSGVFVLVSSVLAERMGAASR